MPRAESQIIDFGGERGTRTLDLGIMSSDFERKPLLFQQLSTRPIDRTPVPARIYPANFACGGTKSDTVRIRPLTS
jgi:hypothetical protein